MEHRRTRPQIHWERLAVIVVIVAIDIPVFYGVWCLGRWLHTLIF